MKILVTGAKGFVGKNLCAQLNTIKDGKIVSKFNPELPERLVDVIRCKNPRCISQDEQELTHIFKLTDREKRIYRCIYCESKAK